jgi:hypothetical protein
MANVSVIASLESEFPGWDIDERWTTAASGPDGWCLVARRGGVTLPALTVAGLRRAIAQAGG